MIYPGSGYPQGGGPPPGPPVPPVGGYTAWYDASQITGVPNGAALGTWDDLSGNGYNLTQGTSTNQPVFKTSQINKLPAVVFTSASPTWMDNDAINVPQPLTFFVVCQAQTGPTANVLIYAPTSGSYDNFYLGSGVWNMQAGTATISSSSSDFNVDCFSLQYNGASTFGRENGSEIMSGNPGSAGVNGLRIGAVQTGAAGYAWNGLVAEIILYPSALSLAAIGSVESYLMTKWGIP